MKTSIKVIIIALVAIAAIAAFVLKERRALRQISADNSNPASRTQRPVGSEQAVAPVKAQLPRLLDLGAGKCIPCKMMAPILEDLRQNYSHAFLTEFIDVWENREAAEQYGIEAIPTQIFYNAEGKELFRHTGFYSKEDILGKWKELGLNFAASPSQAAFEMPLPTDNRSDVSVCCLQSEKAGPATTMPGTHGASSAYGTTFHHTESRG